MLLLLPLALVSATPTVRVVTPPPPRPLGILAAMKPELEPIAEHVTDKSFLTYLGIPFTTGRLEGRPVVLAVTGVGKVNAAVATTLLLDHFQPAQVIFTGIAGGLNNELHIGDVVVASKVAQHDLGAFGPAGFQPSPVRNPLTGKPNPPFFECDPKLIEAAHRAAGRRALTPMEGSFRSPRVVDGVIVTGDVFVASAEKRNSLRTGFEADAVEMEGAAVGQVCYQQQVPFLVLRGISDSADERASSDVKSAMRTAVQNSVALTMSLVAELNEPTPASQPATAR
jgi:adenosylhomocysteine nucleosidase